jgi:hypothetical protein
MTENPKEYIIAEDKGPCSYLKEDETGKHQFDCEERRHPDTNMVLENCFQDQGCCLNRLPRVLPPSEYPETKIRNRQINISQIEAEQEPNPPTAQFKCDNCGDRNFCDKEECFHLTSMPNKMIALRDDVISHAAREEVLDTIFAWIDNTDNHVKYDNQYFLILPKVVELLYSIRNRGVQT